MNAGQSTPLDAETKHGPRNCHRLRWVLLLLAGAELLGCQRPSHLVEANANDPTPAASSTAPLVDEDQIRQAEQGITSTPVAGDGAAFITDNGDSTNSTPAAETNEPVSNCVRAAAPSLADTCGLQLFPEAVELLPSDLVVSVLSLEGTVLEQWQGVAGSVCLPPLSPDASQDAGLPAPPARSQVDASAPPSEDEAAALVSEDTAAPFSPERARSGADAGSPEAGTQDAYDAGLNTPAIASRPVADPGDAPARSEEASVVQDLPPDASWSLMTEGETLLQLCPSQCQNLVEHQRQLEVCASYELTRPLAVK